MEILLVTGYYPPEGGSGARLAGELAGFLSAAGHTVTVLAPAPNYYVGGEGDVGGIANLRVVRAGLATPRFLPHKAARGFEHLVRPFATLPAGLRLPRPDLVYGFSLQPAGVAVAVALARWFGLSGGNGSEETANTRHGSTRPRLVLHIEDLFPDNAVDTGLVPGGPIAGVLSAGMSALLRAADRVLVHAPGLVPLLAGRGIAAEAIPNWVDCGRFRCDRQEARQRFLRACGEPSCCIRPSLQALTAEGGRCVALFAGVLGLAQGMDDLLGVAEATRGRDDLVLAVVGDGPRKEPFAAEIRRRGLEHVRMLPMAPPCEYPRLVAASDVFLVLLPERVKYPVIPSRIGDGLAGGRPLLAALPAGDAASLVEESGGGLCVPPGQPERLARELVRLAGDAGLRQRLGEAGHAYALSHLDMPKVLGRLERMLAGMGITARECRPPGTISVP